MSGQLLNRYSAGMGSHPAFSAWPVFDVLESLQRSDYPGLEQRQRQLEVYADESDNLLPSEVRLHELLAKLPAGQLVDLLDTDAGIDDLLGLPGDAVFIVFEHRQPIERLSEILRGVMRQILQRLFHHSKTVVVVVLGRNEVNLFTDHVHVRYLNGHAASFRSSLAAAMMHQDRING